MSGRRTSGRGGRGGSGAGSHGGGRRRFLRILGVVLLVALLIAFIVSFLTGLGDGGAAERVGADATRGAQQLDRIGARIRVEVLNAAGVEGLARQAMDHLRDRGFDVVYIGNAGTFEQDSTVVVARTPDLDAARSVARALGTDSVVVDLDPQLYVDATVRLGHDWPRAGDGARGEERGVMERLKEWLGAE